MKINSYNLVFFFVVWMLIGIYLTSKLMIFSGLIILFLAIIFNKKENSNDKISTENAARIIFNKHDIEKFHIGNDNKSGIGINEHTNTILFLSRKNMNQEFTVKSIQFSELIETKLLEDDLTVTSISRASQLGGALVGGVIGGGIGAIVGGSGGTQYSEKKVKNIKLQFTVNDLSNPIYNISFLNEDNYIEKYEIKYKTQIELATKWCKMFEVILKRNEKLV